MLLNCCATSESASVVCELLLLRLFISVESVVIRSLRMLTGALVDDATDEYDLYLHKV